MSEYRQLTKDERSDLQARTGRSVKQRKAFGDLPVQVGEPCPTCGALFWWITGAQRIAPSGYCLNCQPGEIESRPDLRKIVADSALDTFAEEVASDESEEPPDDASPDLSGQLTLF